MDDSGETNRRPENPLWNLESAGPRRHRLPEMTDHQATLRVTYQQTTGKGRKHDRMKNLCPWGVVRSKTKE
jgi:hypothetical protein